MGQSLAKFIFIATLLSSLNGLFAHQPYQARVTVETSSATVSDPNLVDLSRSLKSSSIQALIPIYTPTSAVSIDINLRGIQALTSFAANSTTLVVQIPQAGTVETFTGINREDSLNLFRDFIRNAGNRHRLLKAYARYSPIDPIAGNPNSLMAGMAQADYLIGHLSPLSGCDCSWSAQPIVNQVQTGAYAVRGFSKGFDTTSVSMPLRYSYSPDLKWAFIIDAPFTYNRNGGASSLFLSLGTGLRIPFTANWSLTSVFRIGAGGTLDLCTSGNFISLGASSVYNYKISNYILSMTNYAGYTTSTNLWLTGVNFNYHLHNYIFKNGLSLTTCEGFTFFGRAVNFSLSFVDSYFARERLYIKHYDEVGINLITNYLNPLLCYDCLSVGFSYQFGQKNYKGYNLNLAYQF